MGQKIVILTPEACLRIALTNAYACQHRAYRRMALTLHREGFAMLVDGNEAAAVRHAFRALMTVSGKESRAAKAMLPTLRHYCANDPIFAPAFSVDPPNPYQDKIPTVILPKVNRKIVHAPIGKADKRHAA